MLWNDQSYLIEIVLNDYLQGRKLIAQDHLMGHKLKKMKKLFFTLAFMLVGTFAFANTSEVEIVHENVTVESITLTVKSEDGSFKVTFPTISSVLESTLSGLVLIDCSISGSVSYAGASVDFSVTAGTCAEAWEGVKHIISDSIGIE